MFEHRSLKAAFILVVAAAVLVPLRMGFAAGDHVLHHDARAALASLYASMPVAKTLGDKALAVLVFPDIRKAAFIVGAQGGNGVLLEKDKTTAYYNSGALSVGLQAGAQSYGYALFFIRPQDLDYLKTSAGWSLGVGPSIVVVDSGTAKDVSTLTGQPGVYAFIFDQKGLMAGIGLAGQKITKIEP
jgi:lipid-binding SYLF domain-containing protein